MNVLVRRLFTQLGSQKDTLDTSELIRLGLMKEA